MNIYAGKHLKNRRKNIVLNLPWFNFYILNCYTNASTSYSKKMHKIENKIIAYIIL